MHLSFFINLDITKLLDLIENFFRYKVKIGESMKLLHILLLLVFTTCSDSEVYIETILIKPNQSLSLIEPSFNSMNSVSFGLTPPEVYSTSNTPRIRILNIDDALNYEAAR